MYNADMITQHAIERQEPSLEREFLIEVARRGLEGEKDNGR